MLKLLLPGIAAAASIVLWRGGGLPPCALAPAVRAEAAAAAPAAADMPASARIRAEACARRAARWLLAQQGPDGSWRSPQYGVLRGGQAYTPFVLHALLALPPRVRELPEGPVAKAIGFIRSRVSSEGALGYHDEDVLEYPVYATSYAVRALLRAAPGDPLIAKMAGWLAAMQLGEARGFGPESPAYGSWGFGSRTLPAGTPGHVDLAHTRRALEALRDARALEDAAAARAFRFLGLLQKAPGEIARFPGVPGFENAAGLVSSDGGFFFTPVVLAANKGLWDLPAEGRAAAFRSYSTATSDGVLALLAAGAGADDERVRAASAWLERTLPGVEIAGIPADHPEPWADALRFYHLASFAEAASALGLEGWKAPFARRLAGLQLDDGSFVNLDSALMKEDDPVLATALALVALGRIVDQPSAPDSRCTR